MKPFRSMDALALPSCRDFSVPAGFVPYTRSNRILPSLLFRFDVLCRHHERHANSVDFVKSFASLVRNIRSSFQL